MRSPDVIALVGSSATGKTAVAEIVAMETGGEVVCADSRQVFRELEIGTGKPAPAERVRGAHHLFEALSIAAYAPGAEGGANPAPRATAGWYARAAAGVCDEVRSRGRTPILVGGSGLYLRAAERGLAPTPDVDPEVRARLHRELSENGLAVLRARLDRVDPASARAIHPSDAQRTLRALEVAEATGHPIGWWRSRPPIAAVAGTWRRFELTAAPAELRERVSSRTRWMFANGLIEETRALSMSGHEDALERLRAIGYDEALAHLAGRMTRAEAEERTTLRTLQLAKRQRTWFRHQIETETLESGNRAPGELAALVLERLARAG